MGPGAIVTTTAPQSRWNELARVLVDHSTTVRTGERVLIVMREVESFPAVRAVAAAVVERGARVQTLFSSTYLQRDLLRLGSTEQIGWVPELWSEAMNWADVCIDLRGARNLAEFAGIPEERIALLRKAEGAVSAQRTEQTRWTIVRIPTESFAQQAGRSLDETMDRFFRSVLLDWDTEAKRYEQLRSRLAGARDVRITGTGTDLRFSTADRTWIVDDGRINMPGGEVYTAPVEESVNGTIRFENPGVFAGVLMEDIVLSFRDGRVSDARARTNESFLRAVLETDSGASRVGEFGIGTNREIDSFSNDILLDEKILGTVHIALGRSYAECGGVNRSALHWDIIKDLRIDGAMTVDGEVLFENGRWTFDW